MAAPVDSARQATNISTAATSHNINVGSPVAGTLLIVMVRFAAAPGTVTFTGYTQLAASTADASDDDTRIYYRWADGTEGATDTLATTSSVKLAAISWEVTGAANPATVVPGISAAVVGTVANINPGPAPAGPDTTAATPDGVLSIGSSAAIAERAGQSFVSVGTTITSVTCRLAKVGSPTDDVVIEIQSDSAGFPSGTVVGTVATISAASLSTTATDIPSSCSISVAVGTTYWVVARRSGALDSSNYVNWSQISAGPYSGGFGARFQSGAWVQLGAGGIDLSFAVAQSATTQDYLFLTVIGMDSETATATAPSGYSNTQAANSGTGGAVATNCMIWGASKQATSVSSDDPGAWTSTAPANGVTAFTIAIPAPVVVPKSTPVARVSLGSYGEPATRTGHSIKIRARTTSGSTGVIKAALYEGANNRSGDLTSSALTTSLAAYTLNIPDASAANITSYSDLEIRFWGYDSAGNALVFEVADLYLEVPASTGPSTYYGVTILPVTFTKSVVASRKTFSQIVAPFTFTKAVSGLKVVFGQVVAPFTFVKAVGGVRRTVSQIVAPFTFVKSVSATKKTFGLVARPTTFVKDVAARRTTFSQVVAPFTFSKAVSGIKVVFSQIAAPFTFVKDISARRTTFGQVVRPFTFGKVVSGVKFVFGQVTRPFTFIKDISARRTTFGQIAAPFTFSKAISGIRVVLGQIVAPFTFSKGVSGSRKTFSQVVAPFTFVKDVAGRRTAFGQTVTSIVASITTSGNKVIVTFYGVVSAPFTFTKSVSGRRGALGQIVAPFTLSRVVSGSRKTFAQVVRPFTFVKDVSARRTAFGQIVVPFTFVKVVGGVRKTFSQVVAPFTFVKSVVARKTTFGQVVRPFVFTKAVVGTRTAIAQIAAFFTFNRVITGRKTTFSRVDLPLIFVDQTNARKKTFGRIVFPIDIDLEAIAEVQGIRYGEATMSLVFGKDVKAFKKTYGQVAAPYLFERSTQSRRTTFSSLVRPFTFVKAVVGRKTTFGRSALPINVSFVVAARRLALGQVALSLVFGEQTIGQRKALGRTASSYSFNRELSGRRETFGLLDFPIDFVVDVNTGRVDVFSSLGAEFIFAIESAGMVRPTGIILNLAKALYLGSTPVDAVYVDSQKVWSK